MKRFITLAMLILVIIIPSTYADDGSTNINVMVAQKQMKSEDWGEDHKNQTEFGFIIDHRAPDWPVSITAEIMMSAKKKDYSRYSLTGNTTELCLGLKKIFESDVTNVRPFIGGGLARISAKLEGESNGYKVSSEGSSLGFWMSGGIYFIIAENLNLGVIARYSKATVTIDHVDGEAGGIHAGILLGYHF